MVESDGSLRSPLAKYLRDEEAQGLVEAADAAPGDALFFAAGPLREAQELLGALRVALAQQGGMIPPGEWHFVWVTRFPMFSWDAERGRWDAEHHPFTAPEADSIDRLESDPGAAIARAYDLTLNGVELGGGSIRIADPDLQHRVFALLGIDAEEAQERFGWFLRGLSYGAPPHGGVAFGLDRIVMLLVGGASLRDVIAFPKTQSGGDPLTGAPAPVDPAQLAEVSLKVAPPPRR